MDSGVDHAGVEEAPKLLRSASRAMVGLVEEIQSFGENQRKWMLGCKVTADLQELKISLFLIWSLLLDADLQCSGDSPLAVCLRQAREAAFGIEDLQDMIEYCMLQSKLAPRAKVGRNPLLSAFMFWKRLIGCDGISSSSKPSKFLKDLDFVTQETRKLVQMLGKGTIPSSFNPLLLDSPDSVRGTGQADPVLPEQHKVFGRDKERNEIVQMLIEQSVQPAHHVLPVLPIIGMGGFGKVAFARSVYNDTRVEEHFDIRNVLCIVGMGGLGKTTLARLIYNDPRVEKHFDIRSWVFVSTSFNKMELTAEILRSAQPAWDGSVDKVVDFQMLQSELRRFVTSKRYLIVLDDVWDTDLGMNGIWQDILTPLRSADTGSRILVTSRMNTVPHILGASQPYPLNPLDSDDCWALIKEHAFLSNSHDEYPDLQLIGREIAAKLHGSPLAAKLVGAVLGAARSTKHWMNIMDTGIQDDAVFPALRLSYNHLPGHLKRCFAYCSLFPRNWKFDPARLIHLWIAEGFVQPQSRAEKTMEDRAREYFDQLLSRSFFQELNLGSKTHYLMHDLLHDLAESVAAEDCFRIEQGMNCDIPSTVRHLSVTMNNLHGLTSFCNLKKLRTLLVLRSLSFSSNCFKEDLLEKLEYLRVLDLSDFNLTELPQSIGSLLHLRYLSIHGTIRRLPESIGKLLHLQTLCFTGKCSLDKLPAGINMLVNLRHLGVETKYTAGLVGTGRLVNLQGSLELHVEKCEGRTLEELRNINGLHGLLKIKGLENVSSNEEACKAGLNKKRHLNSLNLEWSSTSRNLHPSVDAEVLEGLQPHSDLRELCIRRYCGTKAPSWLQSPSLQQLRSLHLINCRSMGILPPLGHLRSLRSLHMKELCAVGRIGHEFYGADDVAFPSLSVLEFDDFPRLHEWSGIADRNSFPCLKRLMLMDCPELIQIPSFPATTSEVTIERTRLIPYMRLAPLSSSSEVLQLDVCTTSVLLKGLLHKQHIESIVALNISGAEQLVAAEELRSLVSLQRLQLCRCDFTDQTFSRFLQALPCLSSLEIIDLPNITSLSVPGTLMFCTMLTELFIRNCQLLRSVSSLQFFCSLKHLVIERCPKLTATSFPVNFGSLLSLKVLRISHCSELQSLPVCGLPFSLETLHLIGCHPELSRQSRNMEGHYFEKLAIVPKVLIK